MSSLLDLIASILGRRKPPPAPVKPAAPPENPLAAQRKVMKQASELGDQMQQQSDQRLKSVDDTK